MRPHFIITAITNDYFAATSNSSNTMKESDYQKPDTSNRLYPLDVAVPLLHVGVHLKGIQKHQGVVKQK